MSSLDKVVGWFCFLFLQLGPVHTRYPPLGGGGGGTSESLIFTGFLP